MKQPARHAWLVGGGIASLAAATFLVRDAAFDPDKVHVLERADVFGGSLDGSGSAGAGYVIRGGRMFEPHFECTLALFDRVPALDGSGRTVTRAIHDFNHEVVPSSNCRMVVEGRRVDTPALGLGRRHRRQLLVLALRPEASLAGKTIDEYFETTFFDTPFWWMWSTMFAFQPWHSVVEMRRYMRRFVHLMPGLNRLEGILRTPLNQYDSLVKPLTRWLADAGVDLRVSCRVYEVGFDRERDPNCVTNIRLVDADENEVVTEVAEEDIALITLGSMTDSSSQGSHEAPALFDAGRDPAWQLWRDIARHSSGFGRPDVFAGDTGRSRWMSFTATMRDSSFFDYMTAFTGNEPGTGGLVTLVDSNSRMSIFLPHQPHFENQPPGIHVFWGYGLRPDRRGDYVDRTMNECSGAELLVELAHHLKLDHDRYFDGAIAIPTQMPYITSQFMPRRRGDRPNVVPDGARNFAFIGQYCELPRDCVFTVEYSVRSAQIAVHGLTGLSPEPPPVYRGDLDPRVIWRALRAMD